MDEAFDLTELKTAPVAQRKRPWLSAAAFAGAVLGAVVGFLYAACFLALSGLVLPDGEPVRQSFGQEFLLFLRIVGSGAGLGAALFLAITAFVLAICKAVAADRNDKSLGLRLTRLGVVFVLLVAFAVMISTIVKLSLR
jgi:hypothetical protein